MSDYETKRVGRLCVWIGLLILTVWIGIGIVQSVMETNAALAHRGAHL